MQENESESDKNPGKVGKGKGGMWRKWDLIVIAAFLAIDDLRNAFFLFLAKQDVLSLAVLLAVVWFLRKGRMPKSLGSLGLGGLEKMGLFDGLLGKYEAK